MPKCLKCAQCSSMNEKLYEDPRKIPIDVYDCLCSSCLYLAEDEVKEEEEE